MDTVYNFICIFMKMYIFIQSVFYLNPKHLPDIE